MITDTTTWKCSVDASGSTPIASLTVSINGGNPQPTLLTGVAYSPCPLNGSNGAAPALGDWFWDSFSGTGFSITGWSALWARDLPSIRASSAGGTIGANAVRVYSMMSRQLNADGTFPDPWNGGQLFTHTAFLDACWNGGVDPVHVLVGVPLPSAMFWQSEYQQTPQDQIAFWTNMLQETAEQVGNHPAVAGFVIQNEQDSNVVTYGPNTSAVEFWWSQVEAMARIVKTAAPTKLVGMAVHDDPNIPGQAASYMASVPSMDFWGVNTYQTQTFDPVFGTVPNVGPGYAGLTGSALKPVILTEWGMPATGHRSAGDPSTIYADSTTIANAAAVVENMVPQAFAQGLLIGIYYFEYCDEWWNQGGSPNIYTWWGGSQATGFPNGFWDQEGFGLHSIQRGAGLSNSSPIWVQNGGNGGPNTPIDVHTPRQALISALASAYAKAPDAAPARGRRRA